MPKNIQRLNDILIIQYSCKTLSSKHDEAFERIKESKIENGRIIEYANIDIDKLYNKNSNEVKFNQTKVVAMLSAFGIELGLKELLYQKNIEYKNKHHLDYLFNLLNNNLKDKIIKGTIKTMNISRNEFDEFLNNNRNHFVGFRYSHELRNGEELSMSFDFMNAFMFEILKLLNWDD